MRSLTSILAIILLLASLPAFAQTDSARKRITPAFIKNQGEQEEYWAQEIFDNKYEPQSFNKYKGTITLINENTVKYNENIIMAGYIQAEYRMIFENGLFYPALFSGYNDGRVLEIQKKPDSIKQNISYTLSGNNSLGVGIMEEFKFLNPSAKVKRYKLCLSRPGFANPSMYVFELTNENATEKTNLKTFLNEAKLTFLKFVSILL